MGIEAIASVASGIGSAMGRIGPSLGRIGGEGLSLRSGPVSGFGNFVNEGPVGPAFRLENTMPLITSKFNPVPSLLEQAENVAANIWKATEPANEITPFDGEATIPETFIEAFAPAKSDSAPIGRISVPEEAVIAVTLPKVDQNGDQRTQTALEAAGMIDLSQNVANHLAPEAKEVYQRSQIKPETIPQPVLVEKTQKEEAVAQDNKTEERNYTSQEENVETLMLKHVEDIEVAQARLFEIREAIGKARIEADTDGSSEIEGWRIKEKLLSEGRRSGILDQDDPGGSIPDGSRVETIDELAVQNYKSEEEANQKSESLVSKKKPVKRARYGNSVAQKTVDIVKKYFPFGKRWAGEIATRIIRRKMEISGRNLQPITTKIEEVVESRIEDNPALAQVFK